MQKYMSNDMDNQPDVEEVHDQYGDNIRLSGTTGLDFEAGSMRSDLLRSDLLEENSVKDSDNLLASGDNEL